MRKYVFKKRIFIKIYCIVWILPLLVSCVQPVLRNDFLESGIRNPLLSDFVQSPEEWKNRLFILGGTVVSSRYTEEGSLIEAVFVSVNSLGYPEAPSIVPRRFLAIYPVEKGVLDPLMFKKGRDISFAGTFIENRIGFVDDTSYTYPTFIIEEIYLWERKSYYANPYPPFIFSIGAFSYGHNWGVAPSFSFGW